MSRIIASALQDRTGGQISEPESSTDLADRDASERAAIGGQELDNRETPLYARLQSFEFDKPGISLPFSARLARDCMWTRQHTERVCEEYRKFLFLACVVDHVVTPSDDVDQAWHLHLTYTQSYWDDLCANVLGLRLHHTPTEGGEEQRNFYRDSYAKTLQSYESVFGEKPPPDIWPDVDARFDRTGSRLSVDTACFWILPKPPSWLARATAVLAGSSLMTLGWFNFGAEVHRSVPAILLVAGVGSLVWALSSTHEFAVLIDGSGCGGCGGCGG